MRSQVPSWTQLGSKSIKQRNYLELEARSQLLALKGVEGRAEAPRWDQEEDKLEPASNQPTSWLVHILQHLLCQDKPRATLDSQNSPRPRLGGSHHFPPYSILYVFPWHPHPNGFLSRDSQGGVPKLSWFGLPGLCEFITFCSNLRLG